MLERRDWRLLLWAVVGLMAIAMAVSFVGWGAWGWHGTAGTDGMMGGWAWMPFLVLMVVMMFAMMSMGGHGHHGHAGHGAGDDARAILDRRYAAGEISREEYQRMRDDLERRG